MSNDTSHATSAVFNAFIEADKALKELPQVRQELEHVSGQLNRTLSQFDAEKSKSNMLAGTIEALKADLAAKEEALKDATFRHKQMAQIVDTIRGVIPVIAASPSDVPAVSAEGQSDADPTKNGASPGMNSLPIAASVTAQTSDTVSSDTSQTDVSPRPTSDSDQTMTQPDTCPAEQPQTEPVVGTQTGNAGASADDKGPSGAGPTVAGEPQKDSPIGSGSGTATSGVASIQASVGAANPPRANAPYWEKPAGMTHERWAELGGRPAPWIERERTNLTAAF